MQFFDNGAFYTVTCTRADVTAFRRQWPCNGMNDRPVTFQFDKSSGDLIDSNDDRQHPHADGAAIAALSEDAAAYGARKLRILDWRYPASAKGS